MDWGASVLSDDQCAKSGPHLKLMSLAVAACSMGFPAASPHRALLSLYHAAGDKHTLSRRLMPLGVAAAGMALCERRWFHLAKSALPGCAHLPSRAAMCTSHPSRLPVLSLSMVPWEHFSALIGPQQWYKIDIHGTASAGRCVMDRS